MFFLPKTAIIRQTSDWSTMRIDLYLTNQILELKVLTQNVHSCIAKGRVTDIWTDRTGVFPLSKPLISPIEIEVGVGGMYCLV